jgi:hypothetical protein
MSAIVTNLLYFAISFGLVTTVGCALSRSGRAFARELFGGQEAVAEAVNRLLVVAFYLLSAGFIALTMPVWAHVGSAGHAVQLLSGKLGELLLVLGALHLAATVVFARLRRGTRAGGALDLAARGDAGLAADGSTGLSAGGGAGLAAGGGAAASGVAGLADREVAADTGPRGVSRAPWAPRPRHVVH